MTTNGKSPGEIEREIERTRSDMTGTLEEIQQRLSPERMREQAFGYLREGPGEYFANLGKTAKEHPVPVALLGVGMAWLMLSDRYGKQQPAVPAPREAESASGPSRLSRVRDGYHRARDTARDVAYGASETWHQMRDGASRAGSAVSSFAGTVRDNPVPAGLAAAGLGWLAWKARSAGDEDLGHGDAEWHRRRIEQAYGYSHPGYGQSDYGSALERGDDQPRSSAQHTWEEAKDMGYRAGSRMSGMASSSARSLGNNVMAHPLPWAAIGIGAAWLLMSSRSANGGASYSSYGSDAMSYGRGSASGAMGAARDRAAGAMGSARDSASGAMGYARDSASDAMDYARDSASGAMSYARDTASGAASYARDMASSARDNYTHLSQEQPLVLGAVGLLIGVALGALMPRTASEDEWLGSYSDRLKGRAREYGEEQYGRAKDAAREATQGAVDKVKETARAATDAIHQRLDEHGEEQRRATS